GSLPGATSRDTAPPPADRRGAPAAQALPDTRPSVPRTSFCLLTDLIHAVAEATPVAGGRVPLGLRPAGSGAESSRPGVDRHRVVGAEPRLAAEGRAGAQVGM